MTYLELAEYIGNNHTMLVKMYRKYGSQEIIEDMLSRVSLTLLMTPDRIVDSHKCFMVAAMANQFLNYRRTNIKYVYNPKDNDMDFFDLMGSYEQDFYHDRKLLYNILHNHIKSLSFCEEVAIINRMEGIHDVNGNTEKANYRHGFLKLRRALIDIKLSDYIEG